MTDPRQPRFGADGEPCTSCGAPLAADQRYCLSCGTRRAAARLPFRDALAGAQANEPTELLQLGAPIPAAAGYGIVPSGGASVNDRLRRNAPLMALVGILLIALLIGVLLGHWSGQDAPVAAAAQPRPQIIQVGGAAAAPAATTTAAPTTTTTADDTPAPTSASSSKAPAAKGASATNGAVKNLDKLSGKDYQKQIDKLGKTISTGGKAPPKDDKPAAGGGDFEDIG